MKGLAKLLMAVALVVGAVYGGLKSYIHYQTRDTVQGLVKTAAPFVTIEYGGISSDLWSGSVRVEQIKLSPTGINDSVRVGVARVSAGNLRNLFRLIQRAKDQAPPDRLGLALQEVQIDLNGGLVRAADRFIAMAARANPAVAPAAHCGYQSTADLAILRRLGYDALMLDAEFDYDFNKSAEMAKLVGTVKLHDMTRAAFDMKLVGLQAQPADARAKPQLREFGVVMEDLSYNDRLKRFCAQAAKLSEQEYIAVETGPQSMFFKQLGITPGPGLQQAYRDYLSKPGGTIELRVRPSEDLDPSSLKLFKPTDILAMLNATLSVNGKHVQDLSFEIGPVLTAQARPEAKPDSDVKQPPPVFKSSNVPATASARKPAADEFRVVQVAELGRYMNRYVRLHERGQSPREGTLVQINGRIVVLERRYGTGHILVRVPLPLVDKAEVMF